MKEVGKKILFVAALKYLKFKPSLRATKAHTAQAHPITKKMPISDQKTNKKLLQILASRNGLDVLGNSMARLMLQQ